MNKSHRDINPESFTDRQKLLNRINDLDDDFGQPVYIEPKKEPKTFLDRIKAFRFSSLIDFIQDHATIDVRLNLDEFLNKEADELLLRLEVYVIGQRIIKRSIKLL